jgi:curved DNA-binding protein CbpA
MILRPTLLSCRPPSLSSPAHVSRGIPSRCSRATFPRPRPFSSTTPYATSGNPQHTHYEILKVPQSATPSQLKKQFYILSKETHPDMNRSDPNAATRFAQISESYAVLGNPEKRKRYDRDVMRARAIEQQHSGRQRSSAGGAAGGTVGSRPASGLSRRRSVFKGPPPSFYANGGMGNSSRAQQSYASSQQAAGGTFDANSFNSDPDATFNAAPVYKTQTHEDYRRQSRRQAELSALQDAALEEDNFWARFIIVSGIIAVSVGVGTVIIKMASMPRGGGLARADGSRRGAQGNEWTKG